LLAGLWGEWLAGEKVSHEDLQEARIFATDLGVSIEEARDVIAAEYPILAREFLGRTHSQREAELAYWSVISRRVNAGYLSPSEATERLHEFYQAG